LFGWTTEVVNDTSAHFLETKQAPRGTGLRETMSLSMIIFHY